MLNFDKNTAIMEFDVEAKIKEHAFHIIRDEARAYQAKFEVWQHTMMDVYNAIDVDKVAYTIRMAMLEADDDQVRISPESLFKYCLRDWAYEALMATLQ